MKRTFLILLILSLAVGASAADQAKSDIDRFIKRTLSDIPVMPSVGIAIVRDGKPYYANTFGDAKLDPKTAATINTGYYIGSNTKAFTGLACAILAGRGVIDLDAPLTKYLPEVKMAPPLDAGTLTLRKFLSHSSGISNDGIVFRTAYSGEHTAPQLVELLNLSTPGKPGFRYDNLGYVVASLVIERVTKRPWQNVLDELVFTPLGMKHTTAYMSKAQRWPLATGFEINRRGTLEPASLTKNDQMMHAAGGIVSTPNDLLRWLEANVNEGRVGSKQVIPAAAFREVQRQQVATEEARSEFKGHGYGFGWFQGEYGTNKIVFHQGGYEGWRSNISFMPERKIGVAVVTNAGGFSVPILGLIAEYVYDRLLQTPDAETVNADRLAKLRSSTQEKQQRFLASIADRAKRKWQLGHPNDAYVGTYESPSHGTLRIEQRGDQLWASLANLTSVFEPFTEPETARVELIPGTGDVLRFSFGTDSKPETVKWGDAVFQRAK